MIDEPGKVAALSGVDDVVQVDSEEVGGADALALVAVLADVGEGRADDLADVLDDHLVGADVLLGEEPPVVDGGLSEGHLLSSELKMNTEKI